MKSILSFYVILKRILWLSP